MKEVKKTIAEWAKEFKVEITWNPKLSMAKVTREQFETGLNTGTIKDVFLDEPETKTPHFANDPDLSEIHLFAVRNAEGKWFRRKGYQGYGDTWVDDFKKARIYNKIGYARSIVTFFANRYAKYGVPNIYQFTCGSVTVHNEAERIEKENEKQAKRDAVAAEKAKQQELIDAQNALKAAQDKVQRLKAKVGAV